MNWIGLKMRPTQTGDRKNTPGKSSSEVVHGIGVLPVPSTELRAVSLSLHRSRFNEEIA